MNNPTPRPPLDLWGGLECTVNRVGDRWFDQVARCGHDDRPDDLDRVAALGLRALRYPLLWERIAPDGPERADWRWADERLSRLRDLGLRPIVGLVHHGSGPAYTHLLDSGFADGLARYAGAVAARYPWIEDYTPVNEPLTTARFAALYGHWYPHARDDRGFARALVNECRATALAMRAIRRVNPGARLVQTDDLGQVFATPALAEQAEFENHRRWLTWDLLCGRVWTDHPLWGYLRWAGIDDAELAEFVESPCPPDVVGINYYLTSERFLDERLERYPAWTHGGNGRQRYADVEAVRVLAAGPPGPAALLVEAWERYRRPLAISEAHLGCTREEQLRWLAESWQAAEDARDAGADVRAVTVWSLLGSFDWHSLVTRDEGHYEPGVFDLRAPRPRPTALAGLVRELAAGTRPSHPLLAVPGWWRRPDRLLYPPLGPAGDPAEPYPADLSAARPLLLAGDDRNLLAAFSRACAQRGIPVHTLGEIGDRPGSAFPSSIVRTLQPWAVVVADPYGASAPSPSATGPGVHASPFRHLSRLAADCAEAGIPLLLLSDDLVFDGTAGPYDEEARVAPAGPAGARVAAKEAAVLTAYRRALIVRSGPRIGLWRTPGADEDRFDIGLERALRALGTEDGTALPAGRVPAAAVYTPDLVQACLDLAIDGEQGIWHLAHSASPGEALAFGAPAHPAEQTEQPVAAPSPARSRVRILVSQRGWPLPTREDTLARYEAEATASRRVTGRQRRGHAA